MPLVALHTLTICHMAVAASDGVPMPRAIIGQGWRENTGRSRVANHQTVDLDAQITSWPMQVELQNREEDYDLLSWRKQTR